MGHRIQFMDKTTLGSAAILGIRSGSVRCENMVETHLVYDAMHLEKQPI